MTTLREKLKEVYYKEFDKDGHVAVDTTFENVLAFISSECERARGEAVQEQRGRWAKHEQWFYEQLVGVLLHSPHFWDVIVKKVRHGDSIGDAPTTSLTHTKL